MFSWVSTGCQETKVTVFYNAVFEIHMLWVDINTLCLAVLIIQMKSNDIFIFLSSVQWNYDSYSHTLNVIMRICLHLKEVIRNNGCFCIFILPQLSCLSRSSLLCFRASDSLYKAGNLAQVKSCIFDNRHTCSEMGWITNWLNPLDLFPWHHT